ncbi:MAG TPA: hypothetical protein VMF58_08505 [Rhizomicrobium sp.]|nr:hypothetical protein [Rhizomicrobium sp.]
MRVSLKFALGMSAALLIASGAEAKKGQLIPIIPYPGATTTTLTGIADDNNTVVGSYIDSSGVTHGFYGTLDGNYTSFDYDISGFTQARGISGDGSVITGFANNDGIHCDFEEWTMKGGKPPKAVKKGKTKLAGIAQGIDSKGVFAGDYCDTGGSGTVFGMLGQKGKWQSKVTTPFTSVYTGERGVNKSGVIVGFYQDQDSGLQVGTVQQGGTTSAITYPDATEVYTVFEGLNDKNIASGQWEDSGGIVHSFSYDIDKAKFVEIDDPNAASFTQAWGVNKAGLIAVSSDAGSYVYCTLGNKCPSIGTKAITVEVREIHVAPGKFLRYGDAKTSAPKHAALPKLPKGASPL